MEQFARARTVRLRSSHGKYLCADEDMVGVSQQRDPGKPAHWLVEVIEEGSDHSVIRLKSAATGAYLTASDEAFLLGMTGKKILQSSNSSGNPNWLQSWTEWEPVAEQQSLVKLRTRHGNYLRGNGGIPPWRNSVTHDVPVRSATQNWVLWGVETVESVRQQEVKKQKQSFKQASDTNQAHQALNSDESQQNPSGRNHHERFMHQQLSFKIPESDGRRISYAVVSEENEEIDGRSEDWPSFSFKGHTIAELTQAMKVELGVEDETHLTICTRNSVSGKLYPLLLGLPPNNAPMNLVVLIK